MASADDSGFLSRWARRKAQARQGSAAEEAALPATVTTPAAPSPAGTQPTAQTPRKPQATQAERAAQTGPRQAANGPAAEPVAPSIEPALPAPTLQDARALTSESDFSRFVRPDVSSEVKNAALKTLFTDPRFNVMDGLDIYIDDYNKFEPITPAMLRMMTQSKVLNLFDDDPEPALTPILDTAPGPTPGTLPESGLDPATSPAETSATTDHPASDEDPDLRLQPDDAAGPHGPGPGAGEDAGRQP